MIAGVIILVWRSPWRQGLGYLGLLAPLCLHALTEFPFYISLVHWVLFVGLLYLLDRRLGDSRCIPCSATLLPGVFGWLLPLLVIPFMLTTLQAAYLVTRYEKGGGKEPYLLTEVINPVGWAERFTYDSMLLRLKSGEVTGNHEDLRAYYLWAQKFVLHRPRMAVYYNMVLALQHLGDERQAKRLLAYSRWLFMDDPMFDRLLRSGAQPVFDQLKLEHWQLPCGAKFPFSRMECEVTQLGLMFVRDEFNLNEKDSWMRRENL
ncbi:Wzy polymerase domain-containing protein [Dongshaea marina]|uniref:Wzy polymerase domain-containing protein n=1 Tax=Dongshaea marina TaxID=2047966 RepID=UPI001F35CA1F|nr:Wzy polymerase domain-containing protein [Dongshaea marina]